MEISQPPQDEELRNIIDKLAVFVARNGPEFEAMTKQKQQGNPRFTFLYGGEFYNYYMYRVTTEQAILKHKARQGQGLPQQIPPHLPPGPNPFEAAAAQQRFPGPPPTHFDQPPRGSPPRHMSRFDRGPGGQFQPRSPGGGMRMPGFQPRFQGPGGGGGPPGPGGFNNEFDSFGGQGQGQGPTPPQGMNPFELAARNQQQQVPFERVPGRSRFDMGGPAGPFDNGGAGTGPPGFNQTFQPQQPPPTPPQVPQPSLAAINAEVESLKSQKQALEEQIKQSEQNLVAQHQVLMAQQQKQIDESIRIMQEAEVKQLAGELNIDLSELDTALLPIIESCTKDAISGGKAWIFTHTSTPRHYQLLSMYLLKITTDPDAPFNKRLHIIYLVNDVLHHCMRKGAEDLRQVLEATVIPMFSFSKVKEMGNDENLARLDKLLGLWESKCQYVSPVALEKLKDSNNTWLEYHGELLKRHAVVVTQIAQNIQKTYDGYQAQHQVFCQHNSQNLKTMEQKLQQLLIQQQQLSQISNAVNTFRSTPPISHGLAGGPPANIPPPGVVIPNLRPPLQSINNSPLPSTPGGPPPFSAQQLEVNKEPGDVSIPDISRPPPGFQTSVSDKDLVPALPYYELPAGLMVPLVKLEDDNYKPIDPKEIRLPPPCPPSDRLIQAVEAFYAPPSHERPRDSEGWERLGLYEYFKSKNLARKQKEDDIREGRRQKSKSPSPIRRDSSPSGRSRSPPRRRYQSKSPTPPSRRRSRSRSRSRSPSSRRRSRRHSRSRSRSRSPIRRSPTPPSFGMPGLGIERKLDESNKGHQLLKKMGWGGSGLGANEQGIEAPISGGEIRDKRDQYRGVGVSSANDPFELYRKNKGQAFVERMRARAEEKP